jgi:hypothetical protein
MTSGFTFLGIDACYQEIVKGVIIVAAIIDQHRQRKRRKRNPASRTHQFYAQGHHARPNTQQGHQAIITGGAQGIGLRSRASLPPKAASPSCSPAHAGEGAKAVDRLKALGVDALFVQADVSKVEDCGRIGDRPRPLRLSAAWSTPPPPRRAARSPRPRRSCSTRYSTPMCAARSS